MTIPPLSTPPPMRSAAVARARQAMHATARELRARPIEVALHGGFALGSIVWGVFSALA